MTTSQKNLIRIAQEHGFRAEANLFGSVNVYIPYSQDEFQGIQVFVVYDMRSLKLALGY